MALMPIYALPGICKVNSDYSGAPQMAFTSNRTAKGRYRDCDKVRWVAGYPEKIGGWTKAITPQTSGVPRGLRDWRDNSQSIRVAIGTNQKLYYAQPVVTNVLTDITPWRAVLTGTLVNPISTTSGSAVVNINHVAHGLKTGDYVMLTAASSVGGILVAGVYNPITVVDANNYTVTALSTASTSSGPGGGNVAYTYYRITLSNPFTTTLGSAMVVISHTNNGANLNDFVTISGASAVGGITLSGEYQIMSVSTNSYAVMASNVATSSASGGGSPTFQYDINNGNQDAIFSFGYGTGPYGNSGYGTTSQTGVLLSPRTWALWAYGQQLLANPAGGTIYIWDPVIQGRAYPLYGAPSQIINFFITPERFVTALGLKPLFMQIAWPDQSDYTNWVSLPTNTANSGRTLQGGSTMIGGIAVRDGVSLLFSDTRVFTHTYTGDNNVYADSSGGDGTGLAGPLAVCVLGGVAYWMSDKDFCSWNGSVQFLPSDDIRDYVFNNINKVQTAKFVAASNRQKTEIFFFYCSATSTEIDRYVVFNISQQCFYIGGMPRTSWIDATLHPFPLSTDPSGNLYYQENGLDANGQPMDAYIVFDPVDISNGDKDMDVMSFVPDFERISGNVTLSVLTRQYPNDQDSIDGPYTIAPDDSTPLIGTRSAGKMAGFKIESNVLGGDFRVGTPRLEVQPGGARP